MKTAVMILIVAAAVLVYGAMNARTCNAGDKGPTIGGAFKIAGC